MATVPDWLGSLLFGYRHVQSAGTPVNDSDTLNLSSAFSVAYNPATKVVDVGYSGGTVSNFLAPTGSSGTEGVDLGRFDAYPSNGAMPGAFGVKNAAGTGYSLKVDNAGALISLNQNTTVTGTTTLDGDAEVTGALTVDGGMAVSNGITVDTLLAQTSLTTPYAVVTGAPFDPGTNGLLSLGTDGTNLRVRVHNGSTRTVLDTGSTSATPTFASLTLTAVGTALSVTHDASIGGGLGVTGTLAVGTGPLTVNSVQVPTSASSPLSLSGGVLSLGTVGMGNGGLGFTTATTGDIFYASGTNTPAKLAVGGANTVLVGGGTTPAYSATPTVTSLTTTTLTVNGKSVVGPNVKSVTHANSPVAPANGDVILCDTSGGAIAVTAPASFASGARFEVYKTTSDGNAVTISITGGNTRGGASRSLNSLGDGAPYRSDGTNLWES